jgi:copper transport protein
VIAFNSFRGRALIVAIAAAILAYPALLFAHARLERSTPAANAHLRAAPGSLALWFSERPELSFTVIQLLDSAGARVSLGAAEKTAGDPSGVIVTIAGELRAGEYTVSWRTAAADGHPSSGRYVFFVDIPPDVPAGVAASSAPTQRPAAPVVPNELVGPAPVIPSTEISAAERWGELVALITVLGVVVFRLLVIPNADWPEAVLSDAIDRARLLGQGALVLAVVTSTARLAAAASLLPIVGGNDIDAALTVMRETTWGHGWFVGGVGMILAAFGLALAKSTEDAWPLAAVGAFAMAVSQGLTGHAVASVVFPSLAVAVDAIHVIALGAWIGGLILVLFAAFPSMTRIPGNQRAAAGHRLVRAYHRVAVVSVALVILSGLANSWLRLSAISDLWSTRYGTLLMVKLGLVAGVAAFGYYHSRRVVPAAWDDSTGDRFRHSASGELVMAALVLAVTALLISTPLPKESQASGPGSMPAAPQPSDSRTP